MLHYISIKNSGFGPAGLPVLVSCGSGFGDPLRSFL